MLFGTERAVYYQEKTYLAQGQEEAADGAPLEYDTILWSQDRLSGERCQLSEALRNYDFGFQDYADGKIYLKASFGSLMQETLPGGIFVIEETIRQAREVQSLSLVVGMTKEAIYTMQTHFEQGVAIVELYAIAQSQAQVRPVCTISDHSLGEGMSRFKIRGQTMQMDRYDAKNHRVSFEIDLANGKYRQIP